ncbi:Slp family lipoprotein [Nitrospira sp. Kam-Ns4a]
MLSAGTAIRTLVSGALLLCGCAADPVVPSSLKPRLNERLTFADLKESPQTYSGQLVVLGGEVLSAKVLKQGVRIEVLQLPLDETREPAWDRSQSQGRFLAVQQEFLDPATIPPGTRLTIMGEVLGETTLPLDETQYRYPTLEIKTLKIWPSRESAAQPYSRRRPYSWDSFPYWRPWPVYPYPYWW